MTADPRRRRAEQIREKVLVELRAGALTHDVVVMRVAFALPGRIERGQVQHALQTLRRAGRVRYRRPNWELVQP